MHTINRIILEKVTLKHSYLSL